MATVNLTGSGRYKARVRKKNASTSKTFDTRKAAQAWARRMETELEDNQAYGYAHARLKRMTLGEVCEKYLEQWNGKDGSRPARVQWWIDKLGQKKILDVQDIDIADALNDYAAQNAKRVTRDGRVLDRGHKVSPASVNRLKAALQAVYKWGEGLKTLRLPKNKNPTRGIETEAEAENMERYLSREEVAKLLQTCRGSSYERLYLAVLMAVNTGARRGELLGLRWCDINWKSSIAILTNTKNKKPRLLTLSPEVMAELAEHRPGSGKVVDLALQRLEGRTLVFRGKKHPMVPTAVYPLFQAAVREAGLAPLRFHDLRHTCASLLAEEGATLHQIAEVLGHDSLKTTERYAHLCIEAKHKLTNEKLGNLSEGSGDD